MASPARASMGLVARSKLFGTQNNVRRTVAGAGSATSWVSRHESRCLACISIGWPRLSRMMVQHSLMALRSFWRDR